MANYVEFRLKPANAEGKAVTFHAQEGTDAQADVVALGLGTTSLTALDPTELLDAPVVLLDAPGEVTILQARQGIHLEVAGRPVVRVAVCGDHPEHTDRPITRQMNHTPRHRELHRADGLGLAEVHPYLAVGLQPAQPGPAQTAEQRKVVQAAVPTVEADTLGVQTTLEGGTQLLGEQVVLAVAVVGLVIDAVVAGDVAIPIGPDQGQEVDALDHGVVLARPVPADQVNLAGIGFVKGGVIHQQDAVVAPDAGAG